MKVCNILSLDGGGIKGYITLIQLKYLEEKLGRKLCDHFDIISGTSTGGLIASMLSLGYSVDDCISFYKDHGSMIFKKSFFRRGFFRSKYNDDYFNNLLLSLVKGKKLKDIDKCNLIVPSYNATHRDKKIFKSYDNKDKEYSLYDVMRSTASAPTYFDMIKINGCNFIDGGLVINNPSMISYIEALKMGYQEINLISFSTGTKESAISMKELNNGVLRNVENIIDILLTEQAQTIDYTIDQIYKYNKDVLKKPLGLYLRCNSLIEKSSGVIDDVSDDNMNNMLLDGIKSAELNSKLISLYCLKTKIK